LFFTFSLLVAQCSGMSVGDLECPYVKVNKNDGLTGLVQDAL